MPRAKRTKRDSSTPGPKPRGAAPAGTVTAPRGLSPAARKLWKQLAPDLEKAELLAGADAVTLGIACEVGAFVQEAAKALHDGGLVSLDAAHKDTERRSPHWVVFQQAAATWLAYAGHLGLSPKARAALPTGGNGAGNAFEEFMRRGVEMRQRRQAEPVEAEGW